MGADADASMVMAARSAAGDAAAGVLREVDAAEKVQPLTVR